MDYIAAPFGSQESLLMEYGVETIDYTFDDQGNPVKTDKGQTDTLVPWFYLAVHPAVLYNANDPDFARTACAEEQKMVPIMIRASACIRRPMRPGAPRSPRSSPTASVRLSRVPIR